jgi:hypothetical protein
VAVPAVELLSQRPRAQCRRRKKLAQAHACLPQTGSLCKKSIVPPLYFKKINAVFVLGSPDAQTALQVRAGGGTQEAPEGRAFAFSVASCSPEGGCEASDRRRRERGRRWRDEERRVSPGAAPHDLRAGRVLGCAAAVRPSVLSKANIYTQ